MTLLRGGRLTRSTGGIRDRFRSQMRQEVKDVALRQLAEGGPQALSVNAIAKGLGVSGPALYRYFAGRDALLTELILDAYADLTAALTAASPGLAGLADAYRAWAVAQPHRYRLLFSAPLPGYDAHEQRLVAAAQQAMNLVFRAVTGVRPAGDATPATAPIPAADRATTLDPVMDAQLTAWAPEVEPARALAAITVWSRLHGLVSLEIEGNFASIGLDPDRLFAREVAALLEIGARPSPLSSAP
jgi:AcrR family transcriptional regulator